MSRAVLPGLVTGKPILNEGKKIIVVLVLVINFSATELFGTSFSPVYFRADDAPQRHSRHESRGTGKEISVARSYCTQKLGYETQSS